MTYCLDTNVVVDIFRGEESLQDKIDEVIALGEGIFLTPVTLCELFRGAYGHIHAEQKIREIEKLILNYGLLAFDLPACKEFGEMYESLKKKGKLTSEFDLMIAAIAKANNLIVVTRNKKHFEHTGVQLQEW